MQVIDLGPEDALTPHRTAEEVRARAADTIVGFLLPAVTLLRLDDPSMFSADDARTLLDKRARDLRKEREERGYEPAHPMLDLAAAAAVVAVHALSDLEHGAPAATLELLEATLSAVCALSGVEVPHV